MDAHKHLHTEARIRELEARNRELEEEVRRLRGDNEALRSESTVDYLTGLVNLRGFIRSMELRFSNSSQAWYQKERRRRRRQQERSFGTLVAIDLSGFKGVNDAISRDSGDQTLNFVASTFKESVRHGDMVARVGGDEFAIYFDRQSKEFAEERMKYIHQGVRTITLGMKIDEIRGMVNRDFLVDFRYTTTEIDRKVDFLSLLRSMLDKLEHTGGSDLRLGHIQT